MMWECFYFRYFALGLFNRPFTNFAPGRQLKNLESTVRTSGKELIATGGRCQSDTVILRYCTRRFSQCLFLSQRISIEKRNCAAIMDRDTISIRKRNEVLNTKFRRRFA